MIRRVRVLKQTVWGLPRKYGARQWLPGKARAHPNRAPSQGVRGKPSMGSRGPRAIDSTAWGLFISMRAIRRRSHSGRGDPSR